MFARRVKEDLSLENIQAATVARLTDEGEEGKSPYEKAVDNVAKNAALDCEQPVFDKLGNVIMVDGKPLTAKDSKMAMASAKSLDSVAKLMGLPHKTDKPTFDIKIVQLGDEAIKHILARQGGIIPDEHGYRPPKPSFIDAEVVETYPKPSPSQPSGRTQRAVKEAFNVEELYRANEAKILSVTKGLTIVCRNC
jgi:hypothetical protein